MGYNSETAARCLVRERESIIAHGGKWNGYKADKGGLSK